MELTLIVASEQNEPRLLSQVVHVGPLIGVVKVLHRRLHHEVEVGEDLLVRGVTLRELLRARALEHHSLRRLRDNDPSAEGLAAPLQSNRMKAGSSSESYRLKSSTLRILRASFS